MGQPRIYSKHALQTGAAVELDGSAARHIARVLRLSAGDRVVLFDGAGIEHDSTLIEVGKNRVRLAVGPGVAADTEAATRISLWQGLCRGARMDSIIQKTTELGVSAIEPFYADRGIVRMDAQRAEKRLARWREIAISACEQCGRAILPDIAAPVELSEKLAQSAATDTKILLHPEAEEPLETVLQDASSITLLVGPEGGLTPVEVKQATEEGFRAVRLGKRILRTETAPLAAISIIQYVKGDLG
ncbi:MAG: 16S rRNA (uracil(1498)-N(3))-methyltransferase [Gammaproteobacteria bacterium]